MVECKILAEAEIKILLSKKEMQLRWMDKPAVGVETENGFFFIF
jgi:hypothetical protein